MVPVSGVIPPSSSSLVCEIASVVGPMTSWGPGVVTL